jgi:hypothetical protein
MEYFAENISSELNQENENIAQLYEISSLDSLNKDGILKKL